MKSLAKTISLLLLFAAVDYAGAQPVLSAGAVTGSSFTFNASGGTPGSQWTEYFSADMTNWMPVGLVTLDISGSYTFNDNGLKNEVMYRFYKLSNGTLTSHMVGFVRVEVGAQSVIADQLWQAGPGVNNTLAGAFGSQLPSGSVVSKWNGQGWTSCPISTWPSVTLNPGEVALVQLPSGSSPMLVSFTGTVWGFPLSLSGGQGAYYVSSTVPQAGGIQSVLNLDLSTAPGSEVEQWQNGGWVVTIYDIDPNGLGPNAPVWYEADDATPAPEPVLGVGDGVLIVPLRPVVWNPPLDVPGDVPALSAGAVTGSSFTFSASGDPGTNNWTVYASVDLTNWTPVGTVTLDVNGNATFTDTGLKNEVRYKFYKLYNGTYTSHAVGFMRVEVGAQSFIADQLWQAFASDNTLAGAFGSQLPSGSVVSKWNGQGWTSCPNNTWSSVALNPGEVASVELPSGSAPMLVAFTGTVPDGGLYLPLPDAQDDAYVSAIVPQAGGIQSVLGLEPSTGTQVAQWRNGQWVVTMYDTNNPDGLGANAPVWYEADDATPAWEPRLGVGDGVELVPGAAGFWIRSYSDVPGNVPAMSAGTATGSSFTFSASGASGTTWTVLSSVDLVNWTPMAGVTLDVNGNATITDNDLNEVLYKFYKLSNGTHTTHAVGLVQVEVGAQSFIADQLWQAPAGDNTLATAFGSQLPSGSVVSKWNGQTLIPYTYNNGTWSSPSVTLNPGEAALVELPGGSAPMLVTFTGTVPDGGLYLPLPGAQNTYASSMVPQAGGIKSVLGWEPSTGTQVEQWQNGQWVVTIYDTTKPGAKAPVWYAADDATPASEPRLGVGDGVELVPGAAGFWSRTYYDTGSSVPVLSPGAVTASSFAFSASGEADTKWVVLCSVDLVDWVPMPHDNVTLNVGGTATFTDTGLNSEVMHKFYKLCNGTYTSHAVGFVRVEVGAQSLIADQLWQAGQGANNPLAGAFGSQLPPNSEVLKWNGQVLTTYTYSGSSWSPAGGTLNPGEAAFVVPSGSSPTLVTFTGTVPDGGLYLPLPGLRTCYVSSIEPRAGGIQSGLGLDPSTGTQVEQWRNDQWAVTIYDTTDPDKLGAAAPVWYQANGVTPAPEPVLGVGDGVMMVPQTAGFWLGSYRDVWVNVPVLSVGVVTASSLTFSLSGVPGTKWTVLSSVDLLHWTPMPNSIVMLDANGQGTITVHGLNGVNFYKLSGCQ